MIFIFFFGLIIAIFVGLNILDNSNINKIEAYFKAQECQTISYVSGEYRGVCRDKIILMRNAFSVDVSQPEKLIHYNEIQNIKRESNFLVIKTSEDTISLDFKEPEKLEEFYISLENKL